MPIRLAAATAAAATAAAALLAPVATAAPHPSSALFRYADPQIAESSGIAASSFDDTLYTHNDSGDSARFFRVDRLGRTVAIYTLRGAKNVDWEDMATGVDAAGHPALYFGDIGDNDRQRKEIEVYRVSEPSGPSGDVAWTRYRFAYPDGPHDAEALLVDPRDHRVFIATKELLRDGRLYEAPALLRTDRVNVLAPIGLVPPLTTSADFSPNRSRIVLLTYLGAFWSDDVGGAWHRYEVPLPPQAEAIAYARDGSSMFVGGEGVHSQVYQVSAPELGGPAPPSASPPAAAPSSGPAENSAGVVEKDPVPVAAIVAAIVFVLVGAGAFFARWARRR